MAYGKSLFALCGFAASALAYTWPNLALDEIENQVWDLFGLHNHHIPIIAGGVTPCNEYFFRNDNSTLLRSDAADWIRTSYHDMATYNITDGTGGLDGSIQFELDRPENAGNGLLDTSVFMTPHTRFMGLADNIALAAKLSIEICGGPYIPYRAGRVDATEANAGRVPQPQEGLEDHIAAFERMGFNQTEMITLVACGHSFGGVQHSAFPTIVPLDNGLSDEDMTFDSTPFTFDNTIAYEWYHGTTADPLAVGLNDTTNSDKRIFGSDGNVTMAAYAQDPQLFRDQCSALFTRMLHTSPSNAQWTEVIDVLPVKPWRAALQYMADGTLMLTSDVRFWNMTLNDNRSVKILWADRDGNIADAYTDVLARTPDMVGTGPNMSDRTGNGLPNMTDIRAVWYHIGPLSQNYTLLNETTGLSKFWFEIDEGDGTPVRVEDQGGVGFVLQDQIMLSNTSCIAPDDVGTPWTAVFDVAVRTDTTPSRIWLEFDVTPGGVLTEVITNTTDAVPINSTAASDLYTFWQANITQTDMLHSEQGYVNIAATVGSDTIRTTFFVPFSLPSWPACP